MTEKTLTDKVKEAVGLPSGYVYTRNSIVADKLQKAGYVVIKIKQMTIFGENEFELKGSTELTVEELNKVILKNCKKQSEIDYFTVKDFDLNAIYEESVPPTKEVIEMKRLQKEVAENRKKKRGKK